MTGSDPGAVLRVVLEAPQRTLLVSDVDGTLAPIAHFAADALADADAVAALGDVAVRVGLTALLTGRPAGVAAGLGAFGDIPGLVILGHYGLDRWEGGQLTTPPPDPSVAQARAALPELPSGAYVEEKGLSFVVHTRPAADPAGALAAVDQPLRAIAARFGLEIVDGSFARELRPPGIDKGTALRQLAADFGDPAAVVYLGDDDGDLPAADELDRMRKAGTSTLLVCAERDGGSAALLARADVVVAGVAGVAVWLRALGTQLA